ncbi:GFA family protein [Acuticoccus sediminis]|uniref:GFA family protein n=1 Tax=Acuticoccus sediminis TaxID=2184697 RepID=UPI001CFD77DA|nr:GFA family protein [Acuticoccus sediminis]
MADILAGGCTCGRVRYEMQGPPMIVHACHCTWCQRETGSAFATNAMIEADRVRHTGEEPEIVHTPSASGKGQMIARCPHCRVAIWSNYSGSGPRIRFVRVGSLDNPHSIVPDIHIFTSTKRPWLTLPEGVPVAAEYYRRSEVWSADSIARREAVLARPD